MNRRRMQSGQLRHTVQWNAKITSPPVSGTNGQPQVTFPSMGTLWAEILPIASGQVVNSTQLVPTRSHAIKVRYTAFVATMKAQDQLIFQGRTLTVTSTRKVEERDFWLEITADEQAGNQPGSP